MIVYIVQFAMGLNMPAKTVVFTAVKKWDGDSHRFIGSGEYIQVSEDCYVFLPAKWVWEIFGSSKKKKKNKKDEGFALLFLKTCNHGFI